MLSVKRIFKTFVSGGREVDVLRDISFDVHSGAITAVLGPSGAGKTTLLEIVAGLQKPDGGVVMLDGSSVRAPSKEVILVFQEDAVFPWFSVYENISYGLKRDGIPVGDIRQSVERMIDSVGLEGFGDYYPFQLSGGMKKRVEVARALVNRPKVLLMDEPFASLDVMTRRKLYGTFIKLVQRVSPAILIVTHDVEEALILANRIVILSKRPAEVDEIREVEFCTEPRDDIVYDTAFVKMRMDIESKIQEMA